MTDIDDAGYGVRMTVVEGRWNHEDAVILIMSAPAAMIVASKLWRQQQQDPRCEASDLVEMSAQALMKSSFVAEFVNRNEGMRTAANFLREMVGLPPFTGEN